MKQTRTCSGATSLIAEQKQRRSKWVVASIISVAVLLVLAGVHYRFHILSCYQRRSDGFHDVRPIPIRLMPEASIPKHWSRCRIGSIEIRLPQELANGRVPTSREGLHISFQHGDRAVVVGVPTGVNEFPELLEAACELHPEARPLTMLELRRACYNAASADFRWSMAPSEARWHVFCIATGKLTRLVSDGHIESFTHQDLDGIVLWGGGRIVYQWQSGNITGYIHFIDNGTSVDPTWIRSVSQSLRVLSAAEEDDVNQGNLEGKK